MTQWDTTLVDGTVETVDATYMHLTGGALHFLGVELEMSHRHTADLLVAYAPGSWTKVTRLPPVPT